MPNPHHGATLCNSSVGRPQGYFLGRGSFDRLAGKRSESLATTSITPSGQRRRVEWLTLTVSIVGTRYGYGTIHIRVGADVYTIVEATVREHSISQIPTGTPFYPNGEGYALDGELWWDCYPGCRVFATRQEAIDARLWQLRKERG